MAEIHEELSPSETHRIDVAFLRFVEHEYGKVEPEGRRYLLCVRGIDGAPPDGLRWWLAAIQSGHIALLDDEPQDEWLVILFMNALRREFLEVGGTLGLYAKEDVDRFHEWARALPMWDDKEPPVTVLDMMRIKNNIEIYSGHEHNGSS